MKFNLKILKIVLIVVTQLILILFFVQFGLPYLKKEYQYLRNTQVVISEIEEINEEDNELVSILNSGEFDYARIENLKQILILLEDKVEEMREDVGILPLKQGTRDSLNQYLYTQDRFISYSWELLETVEKGEGASQYLDEIKEIIEQLNAQTYKINNK